MKTKKKTEASEAIDDGFEELLQSVQLHADNKFKESPVVISVGDVPLATMGNFSASTGKPKSKKTFNVSAIAAAALSGKEVLRYKVTLPPRRNKVLYVDTEQSGYQCSIVMKRILRMAGLPPDKDRPQLIFLMLRDKLIEERRDIIASVLSHISGIGLVVLDGLRDLVRDINSVSESVSIISDLMRWSSLYDLHIHTVLHQNKMDNNVRGHIGTELTNKAEAILLIEQHPVEREVSIVRASMVRNQNIESFAFQIDKDGIPQIKELSTAMKSPEPATDNTLNKQALDKAFGGSPLSRYGTLIQSVRQAYESLGYKRGRNVIVSLVSHFASKGIIQKSGHNYQYYPELFDEVKDAKNEQTNIEVHVAKGSMAQEVKDSVGDEPPITAVTEKAQDTPKQDAVGRKKDLVKEEQAIHKKALSHIFKNGMITKYANLIELMTDGYSLCGVQRGRNFYVGLVKEFLTQGVILRNIMGYTLNPHAIGRFKMPPDMSFASKTRSRSRK